MNPKEFLEKRVKKTTINGKEVQIHLLPARKGLVMANKLSRVILPSISAVGYVSEDGEVSILDIASVVVENLDDINVEEVVDSLLEGMTVNNAAIDFDSYFMANYGELVEIVTFAFKENFSSFFTVGGMSLV